MAKESCDGNFYGTASAGGAGGKYGTIFALTPAGAFADIHDCTGIDGANPRGGLVDGGGGSLHGTAVSGGANGAGTLFSIKE